MALRLLRYSYGAVRSRALAAGLLKTEQIGELLDCASKTEAARWLDKKIDLQAGEVEIALHGRFMAFGHKIARSVPARAGELLLSYLCRGHVENLKVLCRNLLTDRRQETDPFLLPDAPGKIMTPHCATAGTLEELLERLPRSPYRDVVRSAMKAPPEERLFRVESGLDRTFWETVRDRALRLPFYDRLAALEILGMRADIERCRVLGRGIREDLPPATLLESLPPLGTLLPTPRVRVALKSGNPATAVARLMGGIGGIGGIGDDPLGTEGEAFLYRRLYRHLRRTLVSPPFDISVPLSSLLLMELETHDLKSIFGGKRVGSGREEILPFLSCHGA